MIFLFLSLIYWTCGLYIISKSSRHGVREAAIIAVVAKYVLCLVGMFVVLPMGGADGIRFERLAAEWSERTWANLFATFDFTRSYLISSITAVLYKLIGRDLFVPLIVNGLMGIVIFFLAIRIASVTWGKYRLNKFFGIVIALHPMLNVTSATVLRENYIVMFALLATYQLVLFAQLGKLFNALAFLLFVLLSSFFHGGMLLMALGLPLYVLFSSGNISRVKKYFVGALVVAAFAVIVSTMEFGKLRDLQEGEVLDMEYLAALEQDRQEANTAYLVGMVPTSPLDLVWQAPIRVFYLLAKPFPWDVRSLGHALVLLDAMLWWGILYLLFKHRRAIIANPAALAILLACAFTVLAFAYGTSNFGTGLRHRTKFVIMGLILVYPFLPKFRFGHSAIRSRAIGYR